MKRILILTIIIGSLASCGDDFLNRKPLSQLSSENFYKTEQDAFQAIMAVYSVLQGPRFYGESYYMLTELASDDATNKINANPIDEFNWSSIRGAAESGRFEDLWALGYEGVNRSNIVLDKVKDIPMDAAKKKEILAEAKFLRALYYWHLLELFGGVPIFKESITKVEALYIKRNTREEVYQLIEQDLKDAIIDLPASWNDANLGRATKYSAYAMLGKTYLYWACYSKDLTKFKSAEVNFKEVINSGRYSLITTSFRDIFSPLNENNKESVFEIQYASRIGANGYFTDGGVAGEGTKRDIIFGIQNQEAQQGFGEIIAVQDWVLSMEEGDPRVRETVYFVWDSTLTGYEPGSNNKYSKKIVYAPSWGRGVKVPNNILGQYYHIKKAVDGFAGGAGTVNSGNNWRMIRYADILLMCAEAINEGDGPTSEAIGYLNQVRKRAYDLNPHPNKDVASYGLQYDLTNKFNTITVSSSFVLKPFPYSASPQYDSERDFSDGSSVSLRKAIVVERRAELAFEYHRFLDMRRWEAYDANHPGAASVIFSSKPNAEDNKSYNKNIHSLCPIPQYQIDISKETLSQNPGY